MPAGGERPPAVEAGAASQNAGASDPSVARQPHQPPPPRRGEENDEEPDVPADGRRVDAQPRTLLPATPEDQRRDPDDERGEGREHERRAEYRPYTYEGSFFRCFARQDGLQDGDYGDHALGDRKSTRLNSSHANISYAVFCLKKHKTSH